jgi:hypothetical protein
MRVNTSDARRPLFDHLTTMHERLHTWALRVNSEDVLVALA